MFETSRQRFLALARSIVRNTEDAEDAVHNAYLSGYLNLRGFEGRSAERHERGSRESCLHADQR